MDRVKHFAELTGLALEEARTWIDPLSGLNDTAFADHLAYLVQNKQYMQGNSPTLTAKPLATEVAQTRAQIIDFMSDFLDARNEGQQVASYTPEDEPDGLSEQIIEYFAGRDVEDEV